MKKIIEQAEQGKFKFLSLKRFTYSSLVYSLFRAIMYVVTSIGVIYLVECFNV
jgi:hypothetical protein